MAGGRCGYNDAMSTFLLIPGAGGRASYWRLVAPRLRAAGHTVVAPDLPAGDDSAGLAEYRETVLFALDGDGGADELVVVGQSMGAFVAPVVAAERSAAALILVAPMIPVPHETAGEWWAVTGQGEAYAAAAREEGRDPDAPFDPEVVFLHDVPDEVVQSGADEPQEQSDRPFADAFPLDAWPDVPTRVIAGRFDRCFPLPFVQRLSRDRLGIEPEIVNSGHLPALACPDELTALLLRSAPE
jgi:pimeloyl-ACP methyl ester carboxylesterase